MRLQLGIIVCLVITTAHSFSTQSLVKKTIPPTTTTQIASAPTLTQATLGTVSRARPNTAKAYQTTLAGKLWPSLRKFRLTRALFVDIFYNVLHVGDWQDVLVLSLIAFGSLPLARYSFKWSTNKYYEEQKKLEDVDIDESVDISVDKRAMRRKKRIERNVEQLKRMTVARIASNLAKVSLSVYAVDVVCVILSTIGFQFPTTLKVATVYSKVAYLCFAVVEFLIFKKYALCKFFKVEEESMGRIEILNRFINVVVTGVSAFVLMDWLSVKMGVTLKSFFALGSVGTVAISLASKDVLSQLFSGLAMTASNRIYVGDAIQWGDGTAGKVLKLGWFHTTIRSGDNVVTAIPNTVLNHQRLSNLSRLKLSQVKQILRFHYDDVELLPTVLESIKDEIREACPKLIKDGTRPFRAFWTDYRADHLEVVVEAHFYIAPFGDAYFKNREVVLMAINRAIKKHNIECAQLYSFDASGSEPEWRVVPRNTLTIAKTSRSVDKTSAVNNNGVTDAASSTSEDSS